MPYPSQEQNAIDAVIQFAINKLGFKVENITLFGWSIGGYAVSWAAMTYPDIKSVVSMKIFLLQEGNHAKMFIKISDRLLVLGVFINIKQTLCFRE